MKNFAFSKCVALKKGLNSKINMNGYFDRNKCFYFLIRHFQNSSTEKESAYKVNNKFTKDRPDLIEEDEKEIEPSFLETVKIFFDEASVHLDIPKYYLDLIKATKNAIKLCFPLVRDDGSVEMISGFRAQHSLHLLPTKGGTRFSEHLGKRIKILITILITLNRSPRI